MPKPLVMRSFLSPREIAICNRLRDIRISVRLKQAEFAAQLGITRVRLASYEYGKAPVRYELARAICYRFGINQRWFACGTEPKAPYFDLSPHLEIEIMPRGLFSSAYDKVLKQPVEDRFSELEQILGRDVAMSGEFEEAVLDTVHLIGERPPKAMAFYVGKLIMTVLHWLPEPIQIKYGNALLETDRRFRKQFKKEIEEAVRRRQSEKPKLSAEKKGLQHVSESVKQSDVKPHLPNLLERLREVTKERGKKSELAEYLGVPLASVSQWLSGVREPGGETTLRLLKWVEVAERK